MKKAGLLIFFVLCSGRAWADAQHCEFKLGFWQSFFGVKINANRLADAKWHVQTAIESGELENLVLNELAMLAERADPHLYLAVATNFMPLLAQQEQAELLAKRRWSFLTLNALVWRWYWKADQRSLKRLQYVVAKLAQHDFFNDIKRDQSFLRRLLPWVYVKNRHLAGINVYKFLRHLNRALTARSLPSLAIKKPSKFGSALLSSLNWGANALSPIALVVGLVILAFMVEDGCATNEQIRIQQEQNQELRELNERANPGDLLNQIQDFENRESP